MPLWTRGVCFLERLDFLGSGGQSRCGGPGVRPEPGVCGPGGEGTEVTWPGGPCMEPPNPRALILTAMMALHLRETRREQAPQSGGGRGAGI